MTQFTPGPIPVSPDFPVNWEHPMDEHLLWQHFRSHYPSIVKPLDFFLSVRSTEVGFNQTLAAYDVSAQTFYRCINGYVYSAFLPQMKAPAEMAAMQKSSQEKFQQAMGGTAILWEKKWLPEIKVHLAYWDNYDLAGASLPALLSHLEESQKRLERLWFIHHSVFYPIMLSMSLYDELYRELFIDAEKFDALELLGGFDNKTVASGQALWELSRQALALPAVHKVLSEHPASEVMANLSKLGDESQVFIDKLNDYLEEYGQRSNILNIDIPSWREEPTPLIGVLKDYLTQSQQDFTTDLAGLSAKREWRVAQAREQLQGYPPMIVGHFEFLLKAAQESAVLSEEHTFWIDYPTTYHARQIALAFGERFQEAGVIDERDDIFYLTLDELKETGNDLSLKRQALINERQASLQAFGRRPPPPILGTLPASPPPDNPMTTALNKFFGGPPKAAQAPGSLLGDGGSPGLARGTAKVLYSLADAQKLEPGDILVAPSTAPPWTPLFATVSAVVTDTGGILSHSAVVAREYGIPAVVGTTMATAMIKDGQTIEVNGNTGMVRIVR